jgi:hypothetical protein
MIEKHELSRLRQQTVLHNACSSHANCQSNTTAGQFGSHARQLKVYDRCVSESASFSFGVVESGLIGNVYLPTHEGDECGRRWNVSDRRNIGAVIGGAQAPRGVV